MRKLLLTLLSISTIACVSVNAAMVIVDYQGDTHAYQQTVERNLVINGDEEGIFDVVVKPLDDELRSVDGKTAIPLRYLFINNNREDVYLRYNEYSYIFRGIKLGFGIPQQITAKIRDYGMVPAGIYNMNFEIQVTEANSSEIVCTSNFNLQFNVPAVHQLNTNGETPIIQIGARDAVSTNQRVTNQNSPMIHINSNSDWILYLNTDNFDNSVANYYVRTIGASTNVKARLQDRTLIVPGKDIVIAKGKGPTNGDFVTVEYSIENKGRDCIRAGNYENRLRYVLREDRE